MVRKRKRKLFRHKHQYRPAIKQDAQSQIDKTDKYKDLFSLESMIDNKSKKADIEKAYFDLLTLYNQLIDNRNWLLERGNCLKEDYKLANNYYKQEKEKAKLLERLMIKAITGRR